MSLEESTNQPTNVLESKIMDTQTNVSSVEIPTLADTAMLVILSRKKITTQKSADESTTQKVRDQENDQSLSVKKGLFVGTNKVRDLIRMMDRAYTDHRAATVPYIDKGPRMLPSSRFTEYAEMMEGHKERVQKQRLEVISCWDELVEQDIKNRRSHMIEKQRQGGKFATLENITAAEYPTASEVAERFSLHYVMRPISKGEDFRTQVPEYVKQALNEELASVATQARRTLILRMIDQSKLAMEKFSIPIGEQGGIFRDSIIENMQGTLALARDFNTTGDEKLEEAITDLNAVINGFIVTPDAMRNQQHKREQAASKLADLVDTLGGLA